MVLVDLLDGGVNVEKEDHSEQQEHGIHDQTSLAGPSEYSGQLHLLDVVHEYQSYDALRYHHDAVKQFGQVKVLRFVFQALTANGGVVQVAVDFEFIKRSTTELNAHV